MAGQEESDRVIFAAETLCRQPWLDGWQDHRRRIGSPAEHVVLTNGRRVMSALTGGEYRVRTCKDSRPVCFQRVEGTGRRQTFNDALVDGARAHASGEIRQRRESASLAFFNDLLDGGKTHALQCGQR